MKSLIAAGGLFLAGLLPLAGQTPGTVDTSFKTDSGPNERVLAVAVQTDGKIVIGGWFTSVNGVSRNRLARLNADGSLDTTFKPGSGANNYVDAVAIQPDGKIVIGGLFSSVGGLARNAIARVNADGSSDTSFHPGSGANGEVYALFVQFDGKIVLGGSFTGFDNVQRFNIARVNANGSLDGAFFPSPSGPVLTLGGQGGNIIAGGAFTSVDGVTRHALAAFDQNGLLDPLFGSGDGADETVHVVRVQPDGKVLIGGLFAMVDGAIRNKIARLNPDGSVDLDFDPGVGANSWVHAIAVQSDGKIVLGGEFTAVGGVARNFLARLNSNGSLDTTFKPGSGPNNLVWTAALQADGKPVIGGYFTSVNGTSRKYVARLNNASSSATFAFSASIYSIDEAGGSAVITVKRTGSLSGTATVAYSTSDGTAVSGLDYVTKAGLLTFADGVSSKTFKVQVVDDSRFEGDETLHLTLSNPSAPAVLGSPATATLKIVDDDSEPGIFTLGASAYTVGENEGSVAIVVRRLLGADAEATVEYLTLAGTAEPDLDYTPKSNILTFAPGETAKTIQVAIRNDTEVEPDETFSFKLLNPTGGTVLGDPSTAVITIRDDDLHPGSLAFASAAYAIEENAGPARITVTRSGGSSGVVGATYLASSGSATAGDDFPASSGTLIFNDGEISKSILIPIFDDTLKETNESFRITLSNPTGGATLASPAETTVTILDNDASPVNPAPVIPALESIDGEQFFTVSYRRSRAAPAQARVETSTDLKNWCGAECLETVSVSDNGDGTERVLARVRLPVAMASRQFVRVTVAL